MLVASCHHWLVHAVDITAIAAHLEQWTPGYTKSTLSFSTSLLGRTFVYFLAMMYPVKNEAVVAATPFSVQVLM